MTVADETIVEQPIADPTVANTTANAANDAVTFRDDVSNAMTVLSGIYEGFYKMLEESYEIEEQLVTTDMSSVAEQFTQMVAGIQKRFDALKGKAAKAEEVEAELTTLKSNIAQAEATKAAEEKLNTRTAALAEVGIELVADKADFYVNMADDMFVQYVEDLKLMKGNSAKAEVKKPIIPEPTQSSVSITAASLSEIVALIRDNK